MSEQTAHMPERWHIYYGHMLGRLCKSDKEAYLESEGANIITIFFL